MFLKIIFHQVSDDFTVILVCVSCVAFVLKHSCCNYTLIVHFIVCCTTPIIFEFNISSKKFNGYNTLFVIKKKNALHFHFIIKLNCNK